MGCHKTSVNNYQIRCCVLSQESEDHFYTAADTCNLAYRIRVCWRWWHAVLWRFSLLIHCVPSVSFNASNSCNISPNFHIFFIARHPYVGVCLLNVEVSRSHSDTPHLIGLFWRVIGPSQRPLPDNTQQTQETDIHALGGIRTNNPSKPTAADPRLRPRGHWDRPSKI